MRHGGLTHANSSGVGGGDSGAFGGDARSSSSSHKRTREDDTNMVSMQPPLSQSQSAVMMTDDDDEDGGEESSMSSSAHAAAAAAYLLRQHVRPPAPPGVQHAPAHPFANGNAHGHSHGRGHGHAAHGHGHAPSRVDLSALDALADTATSHAAHYHRGGAGGVGGNSSSAASPIARVSPRTTAPSRAPRGSSSSLAAEMSAMHVSSLTSSSSTRGQSKAKSKITKKGGGVGKRDGGPSCFECHNTRTRCVRVNGALPCTRCRRLHRECVERPYKKLGRPAGSAGSVRSHKEKDAATASGRRKHSLGSGRLHGDDSVTATSSAELPTPMKGGAVEPPSSPSAATKGLGSEFIRRTRRRSQATAITHSPASLQHAPGLPPSLSIAQLSLENPSAPRPPVLEMPSSPPLPSSAAASAAHRATPPTATHRMDSSSSNSSSKPSAAVAAALEYAQSFTNVRHHNHTPSPRSAPSPHSHSHSHNHNHFSPRIQDMTPRSQTRQQHPAPLSPHFASHSATTLRQPSAASTPPSSTNAARASSSQHAAAAPGMPPHFRVPAPPVSALSMMGGGMGLGHGPALTSGAPDAYRPFAPMQFYNYANALSNNAAAAAVATAAGSSFTFPSHQQHNSLASVSTSNSAHGSPRAPQVPPIATPTPVVLLLTTPTPMTPEAVGSPVGAPSPMLQASVPSALQYYASSAMSSEHLQALQHQLQQQQTQTSSATADVKVVNAASTHAAAPVAVASLINVSPPPPRAPSAHSRDDASSPTHRQISRKVKSEAGLTSADQLPAHPAQFHRQRSGDDSPAAAAARASIMANGSSHMGGGSFPLGNAPPPSIGGGTASPIGGGALPHANGGGTSHLGSGRHPPTHASNGGSPHTARGIGGRVGGGGGDGPPPSAADDGCSPPPPAPAKTDNVLDLSGFTGVADDNVVQFVRFMHSHHDKPDVMAKMNAMLRQFEVLTMSAGDGSNGNQRHHGGGGAPSQSQPPPPHVQDPWHHSNSQGGGRHREDTRQQSADADADGEEGDIAMTDGEGGGANGAMTDDRLPSASVPTSAVAVRMKRIDKLTKFLTDSSRERIDEVFGRANGSPAELIASLHSCDDSTLKKLESNMYAISAVPPPLTAMS